MEIKEAQQQVDRLENYKAYPTFMKDYLKKDHKGIEHIITDERF